MPRYYSKTAWFVLLCALAVHASCDWNQKAQMLYAFNIAHNKCAEKKKKQSAWSRRRCRTTKQNANNLNKSWCRQPVTLEAAPWKSFSYTCVQVEDVFDAFQRPEWKYHRCITGPLKFTLEQACMWNSIWNVINVTALAVCAVSQLLHCFS